MIFLEVLEIDSRDLIFVEGEKETDGRKSSVIYVQKDILNI